MSSLSQSVRLAWAMALGFFALILAVSSIPAESMPKSPELWRWDKLIHALEYAVAAVLLFRAMQMGPRSIARMSTLWRFLICLLFCSAFGVLDELYQGTVAGRNSSPYDMLADITGAGFASLGSAVFYSRLVTAVKA